MCVLTQCHNLARSQRPQLITTTSDPTAPSQTLQAAVSLVNVKAHAGTNGKKTEQAWIDWKDCRRKHLPP